MPRLVALVCTTPGCGYKSLPARHASTRPEMCPRCGRKSVGSEVWAAERFVVKPPIALDSVAELVRQGLLSESPASV